MTDTELFQKVTAQFRAEDTPFLRGAKRRAIRSRPYAGLKVLHNVPLNAETMVKIEVLALGGADLVVTNPSFTEPDPLSVEILKAPASSFAPNTASPNNSMWYWTAAVSSNHW